MKSKIILSDEEKKLIPAAFEMLKYTYSPYSNFFKVGAAFQKTKNVIYLK